MPGPAPTTRALGQLRPLQNRTTKLLAPPACLQRYGVYSKGQLAEQFRFGRPPGPIVQCRRAESRILGCRTFVKSPISIR
jgi:hypothetical protein